MDKKLLLFDIDGTLIDCQHHHKNISDKTKEVLLQLKEEGHYIFIASGRPYCYLSQELREFPFDGYILNDGAYLILPHHQIITHPISRQKLDPIIKQVIDYQLTLIAYAKKYAYIYNDDGTLLDYAKTFLIDDQLVKNIHHIEDIHDDIYKIHVQCHNEDDYLHFQLNEQDFFSGDDEKHFLKEIYSRTYTKATALKEILSLLDIPIQNSYFFGDGLNDIEMLDTVGYGIAMENACQEVKNHADEVCKSVLQDGIAEFILESGIFFHKV